MFFIFHLPFISFICQDISEDSTHFEAWNSTLLRLLKIRLLTGKITYISSFIFISFRLILREIIRNNYLMDYSDINNKQILS